MNKLRAWITPITIGSFLLIGVTGLLMFFKVRGGLIVVAHEWLSPVFVVGAALHTWLNWRALWSHVTRARGMVVVGLFAAILLLSFAPLGDVARKHGHGREDIGRKAAETLLQARVSTIAALTGRTPETLRESLGRAGVRVTSDQPTLAELARASHVHPAQALDAVLQSSSH